MAKYLVERDGQKFEVEVAEGVDPTASLNQAFSGTAPAATEQSITDALPAVGDPGVSGSVSEELARRRSNEPLIGTNDPTTIPEEAAQGVGLGARTVTGAAAKLPTILADLAGTILNIPVAGLDMAAQAVGDKPINARIPTGSTAQMDELLSEVFPTPESFPARVIDEAGQLALTGVAGGQALASKLPAAVIGEGVPAVTSGRNVPGLLESIGLSAKKSPKAFTTIEASGSTGAAVAADLTEQADAGPVARTLAPIGAGLAAAVAPQTLLNTGRRAATGILNAADKVTKGEVRAARALQDAVVDPQVAAKAARENPEVLPGRASGEPALQSIEAKVLADDVALDAKTAANLEASEERSLQELADSFGPTSSKGEFQRTVIERGAAPGVKIKAGQPDEMLDDAAKSFGPAYKEAEGFPIQTQTVAVEGGNVSLRESIAEAVNDPAVFTTPAIQKRVLERVEARLTALESGGTPVPGSTAVQVDSADILTLRSQIRTKQRQLAKSGATNPDAAEEAQLLGNVNRALTDMLESQLPADAATALRAVDARYTDFITVQGAVLRSGEKGLTPEALRASAKVRAPSQGQFARGETGDLGKLAEQGKDMASMLGKGRTPGKPDQAARATRDMTPEQLQVAKADLSEGMMQNASSPTTGALDGKKLLNQIETNREVLTAAGYTADDFARVDRIAKQLKLYQSISPAAATKLLDDDVGMMLNLFARIAGSKSGSRVLKFFGGAGVGGSLILTQFGSKTAQNTLRTLNVDKAERVIKAAMRGDKVVVDGVEQKQTIFDALMTRPNDSLKRQADATRTIKAFLLEPAAQQTESD